MQVIKRPETATVFVLIAMIVITAAMQGNFFEQQVLLRTIDAYTPLILIAMGQSVVLISGSLDISSGSTLSFIICLLVSVMQKDVPITGVAAIFLGLGAVFFVGTVNGLGAGYFRLPTVIFTFATSYMWHGLALFLRPFPGGEAAAWFRAFYNYGKMDGASAVAQKLSGYLPSALLLILLGCGVWFFLRKTKFGRYAYAVGSNEQAAFQSGINTARIKMLAYIVNAFFIFLAALFLVAQNGNADANIGDPFTLSAIAAPVIGGIALTGGRGNVYFAIIGALILSFTGKIIFYGGFPSAYQTLINGVIIVVALCISSFYRKRIDNVELN